MIDWENKIISYFNRELSAEEVGLLMQEIESSDEIKNLYLSYQSIESDLERIELEKPSSNLSRKFYSHIDEIQKQKSKASAQIFSLHSLLKYAAASIVLFAAGLTLYNNFSSGTTEEQLAVNEILSNMESKSDTEKIKALYVNHKPTESNQSKIKEILIQSLKNDQSSNVRLASVETLTEYISDDEVRSALIRSLGVEEDPQVQIAIIMALSESKSEDAIKPLEQIINKEGGYKFVKDEAHVGIMNLTSL